MNNGPTYLYQLDIFLCIAASIVQLFDCYERARERKPLLALMECGVPSRKQANSGPVILFVPESIVVAASKFHIKT